MIFRILAKKILPPLFFINPNKYLMFETYKEDL